MPRPTPPQFTATAELTNSRAEVIAAISEADLTTFRAAWISYQDEAERIINGLPDTWQRPGIIGILQRLWLRFRHIPDQPARPFAQGQIALIREKATIWREAKDRVRYWEELVSAEVYAAGMKGEAFATDNSLGAQTRHPALVRAASSPSFRAEFLQANGHFGEAIKLYLDREQDECLTGWERGVVNLRLAECYLGLMDQGEDTEQLCLAAANKAVTHLPKSPQLVWAQRLLDQIT